MINLRGKRVLITQAHDFMGPAFCEVFAELGAEVIADESALEDPLAPAAIVERAGHLDAVIANLGVPAASTPAVEAGEQEWRLAFAHMVDPLPRLARAVLPQMIARRSGKFLLLGSASALRGMKRASTYSAARGAQLAYIQALGIEMAPHNVQVNAIAQNFVDNATYFPARGAGQGRVPGTTQARGTARPARERARGRDVCSVPVQRGRGLLRRPGVPGMRGLGDALGCPGERTATQGTGRMRRTVRRLAVAASTVVALLVIAAAVVYVASERIMDRRYTVPTGSIVVPNDAGALREGRRLATVYGCLNGCHGRDGQGGVMFDDPAIARVVAPNLTAVVRRSSDAQLVGAIRHGIRSNGRSLVVMPSDAFAALSDGDLGKIIACLRSLPPLPGPEAAVALGPLGRLGLVTGKFRMTASLVQEARPPPTPQEAGLARGHYLAVTACGHCHGPDLEGSSTPDFTAPSLRMVAAYTPETFVTLLRTGSAVGGRELQLMSRVARHNLSHLNDDEIAALYRYLRTRSRGTLIAPGGVTPC